MNDQLNAQQCREIIAKLAVLLPQALAVHFPRLPRFDFEMEDAVGPSFHRRRHREHAHH